MITNNFKKFKFNYLKYLKLNIMDSKTKQLEITNIYSRPSFKKKSKISTNNIKKDKKSKFIK